MVQVTGRTGKVVQVEVHGIGEVIRQLQANKKKIFNGADFGVVRAGAFIQKEVKESIMGNRVEHKSVTTGRLANSIEFKKTGEAQGVVKARRENYPDSKSNTEDVAKIIEFSTKIPGGPRLHFAHTKTRNEKKIKEIIDEQIKKDLKFKRTRIF